MPWRRKRKGGSVTGPQSDASSRPPLNRTAPAPVSPPTDPEAKVRQRSADALKLVVEKAADRVKSEIASTGTVRPAAMFVYESEPGKLNASTTKIVSLIWRGEYQKETVIRRVREKAHMEHAAAVLILAKAEPEPPGSRERQDAFILSGVTPGASLSARVDYAVDTETKSITSWELRWHEGPVQNVFLDGIFDTTS